MKIYMAIRGSGGSVLGSGSSLGELAMNIPYRVEVRKEEGGRGWEVFVEGIRDSVTYDEGYEEGDVKSHFASDRMVRMLKERFGVYVYKCELL